MDVSLSRYSPFTSPFHVTSKICHYWYSDITVFSVLHTVFWCYYRYFSIIVNIKYYRNTILWKYYRYSSIMVNINIMGINFMNDTLVLMLTIMVTIPYFNHIS
jgi:hypothetical protein